MSYVEDRDALQRVKDWIAHMHQAYRPNMSDYDDAYMDAIYDVEAEIDQTKIEE